MKIYDKNLWTYGVELELPDVDISDKLPEGASWNKKDYSIVNSNGIANDNLGKFYKFGGEINTKPTNTIEEQVSHIQDIFNSLTIKPVNNYKENLHIHIGVPGLKEDLEALKKVMKYIHDFGQQAFELVDPLRLPTKQLYPFKEELEAALDRYRRNRDGSHHGMLFPELYKKVMKSTTTDVKSEDGFYLSHSMLGKDGERRFPRRDGINMRQLFDAPASTIEFRHFFGTLDLQEIKSCLTWCMEFLNAALNTGEEPKDILKRNSWMIFPREMNFDYKLQQGFERTTPHDNKFAKNKEEIKRNIEEILQKQKVIYGSFSEEEVQRIVKDNTKSKKKSLFED